MVRHKLQYVYRAVIQGLKILKNRHTVEKKITILKYCTIKLARVVSLKITARLPWYVQHPRHCSAAQNKSLLSRLDAGTYFAPYCCSRHISHSTDDGRARNLVVRRVNKQSHLQADKTIFSPSWKSPNCSSRLLESENEFSSFARRTRNDRNKVPGWIRQSCSDFALLRKLTNWNSPRFDIREW